MRRAIRAGASCSTGDRRQRVRRGIQRGTRCRYAWYAAPKRAPRRGSSTRVTHQWAAAKASTARPISAGASRQRPTPAIATTTPASSGFRERTYGPAITNAGRRPRRGRPRPASRIALRAASAAPARARRSPTERTDAAWSARVVAPALHGELALEMEDLHPLDLVAALDELVPAQRRAEHTEIRPTRELRDPADLGTREDGIAREDRRRVTAGGVADVAQRVVSHVRGRDAQAQVERNAAEDNELPAHEALGILRHHPLLAVHLRGVVEDAGQHDVIGRDHSSARVLDDVAGREVCEIGIGVGEVREVPVTPAGVVRRQAERRLDALRRRLAIVQRRVAVALPHLHLALEGEHDLARLVAAGGLHVDDPEHRVARRALDAEHARPRSQGLPPV